ncbi:MAG: VacJ family lipoprotein [Gammaproteobacteria bacterium]
MLTLIKRTTIFITLLLSLSACCTTRGPDPFETFNRASFAFNDHMDKAFLKPIAKAYIYTFPAPVRTGVSNFFDNLSEIPTVANDLLQANIFQALADGGRFLVNSTIGVFGIFDVAAKINLPPHYTDLGLTLAKWGIKESPYLLIPFFPPGTVRDTSALIVNFYAFTVYPYIHPFYDRWAILSVDFIRLRANALEYSGLIDIAAIDPYVFQRDAYMQYRKAQVEKTLAEKPFSIPNSQS